MSYLNCARKLDEQLRHSEPKNYLRMLVSNIKKYLYALGINSSHLKNITDTSKATKLNELSLNKIKLCFGWLRLTAALVHH